MTKQRHVGIDILRIIAMGGIIGLHIIGKGGILASISHNTKSYFILMILYALLMCSVNIFAMITGYLHVDKNTIKYKNIINLLITTAIYCLLITLLFYSFNFFNIQNLGQIQLFQSLFPYIDFRYWYIVSYTLLFFLIPFLNLFIRNIKTKDLKKLLIIIFIFLCIIPTLLGQRDLFKISLGYSPFWLIYCYFIGAYLKKRQNNIKISNRKILSFIFLCCLASATFNFIIKNIPTNHFIISTEIFLNYTSPFITVISMLLIILFSRIKIKESNIIHFLSQTSFGVYVIHTNILIYDFIFPIIFKYITGYNILIQIALILLNIVVVYIVCSIIEFLKMKVFKLVKINNISDYIGNKLSIKLKLES